ncbi:MAG TPA: cell wall hydrolase [Geminicoccaceae bacterium]|nr:cell wall hydrolase [Geminicoccus sp.]HMU51864.1 cell wall hydrolase [Geminicoccaceae bacterium]
MGFGVVSLRAFLMAAVSVAVGSFVAAAPAQAKPDKLSSNARCLTVVGYAEAVSEGNEGMAAVMRVVHNRIRDGRFPGSACAVVRHGGQFQAIEESRRIKAALKAPHRMDLEKTLNTRTSFTRMMLDQARRLAVDPKVAKGKDPTRGALYFVNPHMMDPSRCPWFAKLKRTTRIGSHVFMTHYKKGEKRLGPALDCRTAGKGWLAQRQGAKTILADLDAGDPGKAPKAAALKPAMKPLDAFPEVTTALVPMPQPKPTQVAMGE